MFAFREGEEEMNFGVKDGNVCLIFFQNSQKKQDRKSFGQLKFASSF